MDREDVLKIVRDCRHTFDKTFEEFTFDEDAIMELANAIAAHEREECTKVCTDHAQDAWDHEGGALWCAEAIRARGNK
jgi:hypothetical protein